MNFKGEINMAKIAGVDVLLKVETSSGSGSFITIGGQKGASLKRSAGTIDTTDKNSAGWAESMAGVKSWSMDCDAFVVLGDTALTSLTTAFEARTPINITMRIGADTDVNGYTYTGSAVITDFPEDYPQDDAVSISLSLQGASPLIRTVGSLVLPTAITKTISLPATTGFKVSLSPAVLGLTASNFVIKNYLGVTVVPTNVSTADSGLSYTVACTLPSGKVATVTITKAGSDFGYEGFVIVA